MTTALLVNATAFVVQVGHEALFAVTEIGEVPVTVVEVAGAGPMGGGPCWAMRKSGLKRSGAAMRKRGFMCVGAEGGNDIAARTEGSKRNREVRTYQF